MLMMMYTKEWNCTGSEGDVTAFALLFVWLDPFITLFFAVAACCCFCSSAVSFRWVFPANHHDDDLFCLTFLFSVRSITVTR